MKQTDTFLFFFGKQDIFSNWYLAPFQYKGLRFNCVEQFMMYSKAMLFDDSANAQKILETTDQKTQKALGRTVKNFDEDVWNTKCMNIVTVGCREKFLQNPRLMNGLIGTGNRTLVEASPYDKIWGIGIAENDPRAEHPDQWLGRNLLGKVLGVTREIVIDHKRSQQLDAAPARGMER